MPADWTSEYLTLIEDCEKREDRLSDWERGFVDSLGKADRSRSPAEPEADRDARRRVGARHGARLMDRHHHPSNNAVLGAPPGVPIEQCNALPITRMQYEDGTPVVVSYWMPTADELARLNAGRPVALMVWGTTHAPVCVLVDGDGAL